MTTTTNNTTATHTTTTRWVTPSDIENAKANLLMTSKVVELLDNKADSQHAYAFRQFIEMNTDKLCSILNPMYTCDEHLQVIVGQLAYKLPIKPNKSFTNFHNAMIAPIVAFNVIQSLIEIGVVKSTTKVLKETNEVGKVTWRNQTFISLGYQQPTNPMAVAGLHLEPTVMQKRTKIRPGGKSIKLSGKEKKFLLDAASTPLRLIKLDPSELTKYMKQSEWYIQVLAGVVNMDIIIANELIRSQVTKFKIIQSLPRFYLSMWMDYRTRLYYDFSEMGFNPHGKTFETSLYELAEPRFITKCGFENLAYSAATIIDGRMAHHTAIELFTANSDHYLTQLRVATDDMGKDLYNRRLAQAIDDYYSETASHFLLGEDATNGGLQHGGIGFKSEEMMIPSNVGGAPDQHDSHGDLQTRTGLSTRQEAKDIHQPLLHGSSIHTVATILNKSIGETKSILLEGYGASIFNIANIADWGTMVVDNNHTSLQWDTIDGFKAQSISYTESVPLTLYAMSAANKSGYTQIKIHRDMPLIQDRKGQPIYGSVGDDKAMGKSNKLRGLYANITHSIDGCALRSVIREVAADDVTTGGIWKHDNFLVHSNDMKAARAGYKKALLAEYDASPYESALKQIANNIGTNPPVPVLAIGTASKQLIVDSHYYLAP